MAIRTDNLKLYLESKCGISNIEVEDNGRHLSVFRKTIAILLACIPWLMAGQARLGAAELRSETLKAWERYIQVTEADMKARLGPAKTFLWVDEEPIRAFRLKSGEIQVGPAHGHGSVGVPSGLIHHWIGATFIPNTSLERVLRVTRDYNRYKEYFNPAVIDSQLLDQAGDDDQFSVRWVTKVLFVSAGLDTQCRSRSIRVNDKRSYSTSFTTRVQEVQDYGRPGERELAPDQGDGYIWRLYNITRYEARDRGVYVEVEAIALTRDIPNSVRLLVGPIVKRMSRNSLLVSLRQTREAVLSSNEIARNIVPGRVADKSFELVHTSPHAGGTK